MNDYFSLKVNFELDSKHIDYMLKMDDDKYEEFLTELKYISATHKEPVRRNKMIRGLIEAKHGFEKHRRD